MRTAAVGRRSTGSSRYPWSFAPAAAEERRRDAQDHRHVDLGLDQVGYDGIAHGTTALDAADALDLEHAIARRAKLNGQLGDEDSLDVRRAKALGEIAREDLALDLQVADPETGEIIRTVPGRKTELVLHLSPTDQTVGRFGTPAPRSGRADQALADLPNPSVIVRPVIDLNGDQAVNSYRSPTGSAARSSCAITTAGSPTATGRSSPATSTTSGPTPTAADLRRQPVPRCRGHHRMKTAGHASYRMLKPGTYHWTLPSGTYLVDPTGTYQLTGPPPRTQVAHPAPRPATGGATGMSGHRNRGLVTVAERPPRPAVVTTS